MGAWRWTYEAVLQAQRAELVFRQAAAQEAVHLVAELGDAVVHQALVGWVVAVHGSWGRGQGKTKVLFSVTRVAGSWWALMWKRIGRAPAAPLPAGARHRHLHACGCRPARRRTLRADESRRRAEPLTSTSKSRASSARLTSFRV